MKKILLFCAIILLVVSCEKLSMMLGNYDWGTLHADMSGLQSLEYESVAKSLMKGNSEELIIPESFCYFTKYEVSLLYLGIQLYDTSGITGTNYDEIYDVVLNRSNGAGVILDLANERLSDKVDSLTISDPHGNGIQSAILLLDRHFIINGIMQGADGRLYQTTSEGIFPVAENEVPAPEDCDFFEASQDPTSNLWGDYDLQMEGNPGWFHKKSDLTSDFTPLPEADNFMSLNCHVSTGFDERLPLYFPSEGTVDITCPLDVGMTYDWSWSKWIPQGLTSSMLPYIENAMTLETYHVKRKGNPIYTDWLRIGYNIQGDIMPFYTRGYTFFIGEGNELEFALPNSEAGYGLQDNMFNRIDEQTFSFDMLSGYAQNMSTVLIENFKQLEVGDSASVEVQVSGGINETYDMVYKRVY